MLSRKALVLFESLEQRSLLSATLLGPAGTLSPDQNLVEFTVSGQPTLENLATKATTPIPAIGTFSGDSKNIIYSTGNGGQNVPQLFIYNIASRTSTQAPFNDFASQSGTKSISEIVASNNGRYASFVYTPAGGEIDAFHDVYLLDLQNFTTQKIGSSDALHPSFSPDSQYIAYADYSNTSSSGVFAYNISSASTIRLSVDNSGNALPDLPSGTTLHSSGPEEPLGPIVWSADSKLVAFPLVQENQFTYTQNNYVRNLANNTTEDVTDSVFNIGTIDRVSGGTPALFSPDSKYLVGPGFSIISTGATIAPDINIVGFGATSQQLIVSQNSNLYSVDLTTETGKLLTDSTFGVTASGVSTLVAVTSDRTHAIVSSTSTNLASNSPTNGSNNLYLVSLTPDSGAPTFVKPTLNITSNLIQDGGILSPDGHHVAFLVNRVLHLADTTTNTDIVVPGDGILDQGNPFTAAFTADGKNLLFSTNVNTAAVNAIRIFRYNLATGQTLSVPYEPQNNGNVGAIVFNSTGTYAAVTIPNGNVYDLIIVNLTTGEFTPQFDSTALPFAGFNAAGNTVYFFSADQTAGLYTMDVNTGSTTLVSKDNSGNPSGSSSNNDSRIVGSQDSKYVAYAYDSFQSSVESTFVLNVQTGVVINYDDTANNPRTAPIAFSPDDQYLLEAVGPQSNLLSLVNLSTNQHTRIPAQSGEIGFGFGPGGQSVLFQESFPNAGGFQVVSYDIASGKETVLTDPATAIGLTPDGSTLLTIGNPGHQAQAVPGDNGSYIVSVPPPTSSTIPTAPTTITDDDESIVAYTGNWYSSSGSAGTGYFANDFRNDGNQLKGTSKVTFPLKVATAGSYAVFARWPSISFGTAATSVPFDVVTSSGTVTVNEDETHGTGQWVLLGTFNLGTNASVAVRNTGTNGIVLADAVGIAPSSSTVTPPPPPPPNPIIVDDDDSRVSYFGNWYSSSGSAGTGYFANDFRNDGNQLKGSSSVTFPAPIPSAGSYQVYIRYPSVSFGTAANNVPVDIITSTGTQTITVDETKNTGQFVSLGTFNLDPATALVRIRNGGTNGLVLADAVEFVGTGSTSTGGGGTTTTTTTPPQTIVDDDNNSRVTYTGNWYSSSGSAGTGYFGNDFRNDGNQLKGSSSVKFSIPITAAGSYQVYARWPSIAFGTAATNVPFDIVTSSGIVTVHEDETQNTGLWVLLGTFNLDPSTASVIVRNTGTTGIVLADAVGVTRGPIPG